MFPALKNRVKTQGEQPKKMGRSRSIQLNQKILKAYVPYIQYITSENVRLSPPKDTLKLKKSKINSQAASGFFETQNSKEIIPQEITCEENISTLPTQYEKQNQKHPRKLSSRLESLVKSFQKLKNKNEQNYMTLELKVNKPLSKYERCIAEYLQLSKDKSLWTENNISKFRESLESINPFFKKINPLVSLCLLKIGQIKLFQQNQIVQKQDDSIKKIGIVLWGQVLIKNPNNKMKLYLFPGDSMNEQLIFYNSYPKILDNSEIKKGYLYVKQNAKARTATGILYLKVQQYRQIFQGLIKTGHKNHIFVVENMMKWSFVKKKNIRKQFSYL